MAVFAGNIFFKDNLTMSIGVKLILSLFVLKMKVTSERLCIHWDVDGDVGRVCGDARGGRMGHQAWHAGRMGRGRGDVKYRDDFF